MQPRVGVTCAMFQDVCRSPTNLSGCGSRPQCVKAGRQKALPKHNSTPNWESAMVKHTGTNREYCRRSWVCRCLVLIAAVDVAIYVSSTMAAEPHTGGNESVTVKPLRTHTVGVNDAATVGGAMEITVGASLTETTGVGSTTPPGVPIPYPNTGMPQDVTNGAGAQGAPVRWGTLGTYGDTSHNGAVKHLDSVPGADIPAGRLLPIAGSGSSAFARPGLKRSHAGETWRNLVGRSPVSGSAMKHSTVSRGIRNNAALRLSR